MPENVNMCVHTFMYTNTCVHLRICVQAYTSQTPVTSQYPIITPLLVLYMHSSDEESGIRLENPLTLSISLDIFYVGRANRKHIFGFPCLNICSM